MDYINISDPLFQQPVLQSDGPEKPEIEVSLGVSFYLPFIDVTSIQFSDVDREFLKTLISKGG